jgi:hypothetical protein
LSTKGTNRDMGVPGLWYTLCVESRGLAHRLSLTRSYNWTSMDVIVEHKLNWRMWLRSMLAWEEDGAGCCGAGREA